jgi:hypothetical protein
MYAKSLVVFVLCTALVIGFVVVLNNEAGIVGNQIQALPTSASSCASGDSSCPHFSIVSASLRTQNTSDQLGIANPSYLTLELNISGAAPLASLRLFIGNSSAGDPRGPIGPGLVKIVNFTLLATISVSPGKTYQLSVEGLNDSGAYLLESENVTAEGQVPYTAY